MSKTAQRKNSFYQQGQEVFSKYRKSFPPFWFKRHVLNKAYMAGYNQAKRNYKLSENNSILQKLRVAFAMPGA